jgi:hypothetical protein
VKDGVSRGQGVAVTLRTRKPIHLLTLDDLAAFPVWEFADEEGFEGRDETWVRPVKTAVVPRGCNSLTVAADFQAFVGRHYSGFVGVSTVQEPIEVCQGAILTGGAYLLIPNPEMVFYQRARSELLAALGMTEPELYPITYVLKAPLAGEQVPRSGLLE